MRKIDLFLSAVIGFLNGLFFLFLLGQMGRKIPYAYLLPLAFAVLGAVGMYVAFLIAKKLIIFLQAAKFFLVGTLNTFIDIGVLNIFMKFSGIDSGPFYSVFKTFSFLMATTNSYFWNKYWTFEKKENTGQTKDEFLKFLIASTVGLLVNVGIATIVVNVVGPKFGLSKNAWATLAAIFAAFGAFLWNFLASKFIVFRK
jgi:putative flippase GtrA